MSAPFSSRGQISGTFEGEKERCSQQGKAARPGNITDEAGEHQRLAQGLWIIGRDPSGSDKIEETQSAAGAEDCIHGVTVKASYRDACQDADREKRYQ
jgi:hypothetical protein